METAVDELAQDLERSRLIAILRLSDHSNAVEIATTLCDAGVRFLEVTVENPQGFESIGRLVEAVGDRAIVGAGTVLNPVDVARVHEAGARFVVSPHTSPAVIGAAHDLGMLSLPGALTPTEVALARSSGARFVKLFPGSVGGPDYLRALRGPFPAVKFVPTGGVSSHNAALWFAAGAVGVAMGSNLVPGSGDLYGLKERAERAVASTALQDH